MPSKLKKSPLSRSWVFRTNLPPRRSETATPNSKRRSFIEVGDIIGVITHPTQALRSLRESRRLLQEVRQELRRPIDEDGNKSWTNMTAAPPGYFSRTPETLALKAILDGRASMNLILGPSGSGKTTLLRELLADERFYVLHIDLRIPGCSDLSGFCDVFSQQIKGYIQGMKQYYRIPTKNFNTSMLNSLAPHNGNASDEAANVNRLLRMFQRLQACLLSLQLTQRANQDCSASENSTFKSNKEQEVEGSKSGVKGLEPKLDPQTSKRLPVIFVDEAHKLFSLVPSDMALQSLLEAMVSLSSENQLCHVIHATSNPFYYEHLRRRRILQHCKVITIGYCCKEDMRRFYTDHVLPAIPPQLTTHLEFSTLYKAFGGNLAHWRDYLEEFVSVGGRLQVKQCRRFVEAHNILNLEIICSSPRPVAPSFVEDVASQGGTNLNEDRGSRYPAADKPQFTAVQLLKVMSRLTERVDLPYLPYFLLSRELGIDTVNSMVRRGILDIQWTDCVSAGANFGHTQTPAAGSSGTAVEVVDSPLEELMISDGGDPPRDPYEQILEIVGPKLIPVNPTIRFAMTEVVSEYEDTDSVSEYASLSDVDEY